jgi:hypothetical protein
MVCVGSPSQSVGDRRLGTAKITPAKPIPPMLVTSVSTAAVAGAFIMPFWTEGREQDTLGEALREDDVSGFHIDIFYQ